MRRLMLLAVLAVSSPALSQNSTPSWYRVGGNDNAMSYVDLNSVRPLGGKVVAEVETVFLNPIGEDNEIYGSGIRSEYDCSGNYFRTLQYTYYDVDGLYIRSGASSSMDEHKVPSEGSINEAIMAFVCYREGGDIVGEPFTDAAQQFHG